VQKNIIPEKSTLIYLIIFAGKIGPAAAKPKGCARETTITTVGNVNSKNMNK